MTNTIHRSTVNDLFPETLPACNPQPCLDFKDGLRWNIDGYKAELMFDVEAIEHGITPCEPRIHSAEFDRVTYANGILYRVQIKTASRHCGNGHHKVQCINNEEKAGYTIQDADFIAVFTKGSRQWYIAPIEEVSGAPSFALTEKFKVFLGAWALLTCHRESRVATILMRQ